MAFVPLFDVNDSLRRARSFRPRHDALEMFEDEEFRQRFRFSKPTFQYICGLIREDLEKLTKRNYALSPELQLLCALRFFATGDKLRTIGDTFGIHISSVSRIISTVSLALMRHLDRFVNFPTEEEHLQELKRGFYSIRKFPGVVGAVDGTHIRIQAPSGDQEPYYVNRKGYHSINVQAISDWQGKFLNIVADWPGSTHDSRMLQCSKVGIEFAQGVRKGILLGDSGYSCQSWLLTPLLNPSTATEVRCNQAHTCSRSVVERSFGILKRRFGVLHCEIRMTPIKACRIAAACTVLHNIAFNAKEPNEFDTVTSEDSRYPGTIPTGEVISHSGHVYRDQFIKLYFSLK